ncbi:MAG: ABC transporter permease [Acidobacteriia bacterium]|nr:ABC transporter permease [Terriglobia bacterium]
MIDAPKISSPMIRPEDNRRSFLPVAIRLAWRDLRRSRWKFLLLIVAVASAVAVVTAVFDLSDGVRKALFANARQWLGADIQVRSNRAPSQEQADRTAAAGWTATLAVETAGQISSDRTHFAMAAIKAIDPKSFPLYGALKTDPPVPLDRLLDEDSALLSQDLLSKLATRIGAAIRISGADFRIAGVVREEPDRFAVMPLALSRVIVSSDGLARTGMLQRGAGAIHRLLIRVPRDADLDAATRRLAEIFPGAEVQDYRQNAAGVAGIEEQVAGYFSLLTFMSLAVASLGIGLMMHTHVRQSMDSIAILKLVGGTSRQTMWIYAIQLFSIGAAGAALGFLAGILIEPAVLPLLRNYLSFPISLGPSWSGAMAGLGMGALMPSLFGASALLLVRGVRPNLLLRRDFLTEPPRAPRKVRIALAAAGALLTIALSARGNAIFAGKLAIAIAAGLFAAAGAGVAIKTAIRSALGRLRRKLPAAIRYGAGNFGRPGSLAATTVVIVGLSVCFLYVADLLRDSLAAQVLSYSPFHGANLYVLNVGPQQQAALVDAIRARPGVKRADLDPFLVLRLQTIRGPKIRRTWFAAIADTKPPSIEVEQGAWWSRDDGTPRIALSRRAASALDAKIGDTLDFSNGPELVRVRVSEIHRTVGPDALRYHLILNPAAVTMTRVTYNGAIWADDAAVDSIQAELRVRYPSAMALSQSDVAAIIQDTASQAAALLGLVSAIGVAGGAVILAVSIFAMRFQHQQEISVLKALGATRGQIVAALCAEFTLIGVAAALLGVGLGNALGAFLGNFAFETPLETFWNGRAALLTAALTILVTNAAGWGASVALLKRKPNEILRGD